MGKGNCNGSYPWAPAYIIFFLDQQVRELKDPFGIYKILYHQDLKEMLWEDILSKINRNRFDQAFEHILKSIGSEFWLEQPSKGLIKALQHAATK